MIINLCDIMAVVGYEVDEFVELKTINDSFFGEEFLVTGTQPFTITIKHTRKEIISVNADLTVMVERNCNRCLEKVSEEYVLHISRDIDVINKKAIDSRYDESMDEADEISYIEDCNLDVDLLVLDELYTILPTTVLCKEDCKGICKVCGRNLNLNTCDCDQTVPDPRMAVFSDIFNQFKEV